MRRTLVRLGLIGWCLAGAGCHAPAAGTTGPWSDVAWLAGTWSGERDGVVTEEHWTAPRGDSMLGVNRTIRDDRTIFFEFLRIERDDLGFVYLASPRGRFPPTPFRRIDAAGARGLVFENAAHDFPQRIIYQQGPGGALHQRIEGDSDGEPRATGWVLERVSGG